MNKCYYRIVWENYPSDKTPLNEQNLNKIDIAVDETDNRIISLDSTKFDKSEAQMLVKYIEYDESTGIFKITHYNGASYEIDTLLEKLAINFDYNYRTQQLIIELSDGEKKYVDLSALLTQYEFLNSDTVMFTVDKDGRVTADIIEGSIQEKHLRPDYLADIKVEAAKAEASANDADESAREAAASAAAAKSSETAAGASETASTAAAQGAADSAATASEKAASAEKSADDASVFASNAKESETNAGKSEELAASLAASAGSSAAVATEKSGEAKGYADISKSYAVGTDGEARPGDTADNSKYYSEMAAVLIAEAQRLVDEATRIIAATSQGALIPAGTVSFYDLPSEPETGYMYNISDDFTTDSRFAEGAGVFYRAGANVYWTADRKWDVLTGAAVTGVKGDAETTYHVGNVNLTPANIGAAPASHASTETTYGISTAANYGHAMASSTTPKANGTAAVGAETAKFARGDHVHPLQTSVSGSSGSCTGNAATATTAGKVANTLTVKANGTSLGAYDGSAAKEFNITPAGIGAQATITGGASTIVSNNLTVSRVLVSNASGKVAASNITSTELGYLSGISGVIKIRIYESVTAYSSANVARAIIPHDLNQRIVAVLAAITSADGLKTFPYSIAPGHNASNLDIVLYSASQWTAANSAVSIKAVVFYI